MFQKKSLGQNFLKSEPALLAMVLSSNITPEDLAVEIGPGDGGLTRKLLETGCTVMAFEKDHRLIPILIEKFSKELKTGRFKILEKDVLEINIDNDLPKKYKLVANIPYYITGQIIRMFLESINKPESITLLVQKEVADRIVAKDGKESLLSLSVKIFGEPKFIKKVLAGSFVPAPKVDSAIIHISEISDKKLDGLDPRVFFDTIHAGFAHKRKQLLPNLSSIYTKEKLITAFEECKIPLKARAEDISLPVWVKLCNILNL